MKAAKFRLARDKIGFPFFNPRNLIRDLPQFIAKVVHRRLLEFGQGFLIGDDRQGIIQTCQHPLRRLQRLQGLNGRLQATDFLSKKSDLIEVFITYRQLPGSGHRSFVSPGLCRIFRLLRRFGLPSSWQGRRLHGVCTLPLSRFKILKGSEVHIGHGLQPSQRLAAF